MIGLNCATGPDEMSEHLRYLSRNAQIPVSVMPNAGLPILGKNGAEYPLKPAELAASLKTFIEEYGLAMVGGCCGTTPEHITAVHTMVTGGITPAERTTPDSDAVSSLYTSVNLTQDAGVTIIGERTNANGSKAFREAMLAGDLETCVDIAKQQTRDGAHMLDLCVDYVGRDGRDDMAALASLLATSSTLPIMIDSTEPDVIQTGLEHLGGRCAVNSVNFEDGDGPGSRYQRIMQLVKTHGAAVVALTIDEEGQARTAEKKLAIAENAEDSTTPDRIRRNGVSPPCAMVMAYTVAVATSAPISAPPERAYNPRLLKRPNVKTAVAPTLAPDDTPSKYGSASGFRTRVCIATPASDRPAPTINANTPRGARSSHTIESTAWLGPLPP